MNRTLLSIPKNWVVAFSFKKLDVILQLLHSVILRLEHRTTKFMGRGACSLLEWVYWNVEGFSPRINGEEDNTKIKADFQELLVMGIKIRILLHKEGGWDWGFIQLHRTGFISLLHGTGFISLSASIPENLK